MLINLVLEKKKCYLLVKIFKKVWILRKVLNELEPLEAMEFLLDRLRSTKDNSDFLSSMNS